MPTLLRPTAVAHTLTVSAETIRRLCRNGELPCVKIGTQWRIPSDALDVYLKRLVNGDPNDETTPG